jgi:DNA mismatch repair protein MutL
VVNKFTEVKIPEINYNPNYNPFDEEKKQTYSHSKTVDDYFKNQNVKHWETLYQDFNASPKETQTSLFQQDQTQKSHSPEFMQLKNKYILLPSKSGLMIIDQKRAHERILFEQYLASSCEEHAVSQKTLFPQVIELNPHDHSLLIEYIDLINKTGFDIQDFGGSSLVVNGCPAALENPDPKELIASFINELNNNPFKAEVQLQEYIASLLAKATSINYGKSLSQVEMNDLVDRLFACSNHNFCPDGKPVITILGIDELEKRLK